MKRVSIELNDEVAALGDLARHELAALWQKAHGHPPPKGIRQEFLIRSATWHLQVKRLGGLSPGTRRLLKAAIIDVASSISSKTKLKTRSHDDADNSSPVEHDLVSNIGGVQLAPSKRRRASLAPGARLVRDWNGKTHVVDVIEEGFVFQAKVHKSLTAIAHQITGAHWSGPRFFGL